MSKLIVISADALVHEDTLHLRKCPNFRRYLESGCEIRTVKSIYPSVTYPCHTTMLTGVYPEDHGVVSNFVLHPELPVTPWEWFHQSVKTPDLFHAAKQNGLTTASVFWPVTGGHPDIDHLIAEYWTQGTEDTLRNAFSRAGSSGEMLDIIEHNAHLLVERKHPMVDEFIVACTIDTWKRFKPDLLMLHPANIDGYRHQTGLFTDRVTEGIEETDRWLGEVMRAVEESTSSDQVNLVLTSDHGQLEVKRVINLNVLFAEHGLLEPNAEGGCARWDAYCLANGLSSLIYLSRPDDGELSERVYKLLCELRDRGIYGIGEVMTHEESAQREHLDGNFSFVIEGDGYTSFGGACTGSLVEGYSQEDYRYGKASHGHLPQKGPQPVFLAKGPAFRPNSIVESCNLVDIAPTLAKALHVELPNAVGKAIGEVLV